MDIQSVILDKIMLDDNLLPLQFSINEKLNNNSFAYVFDEVGCGKTIEAGIAIFDAIKNGSKNILKKNIVRKKFFF